MPVLYLNGKFLEHDEASLDPLDRGMLAGDGLFETIRCEEGQLVAATRHFARLARGARHLEIPWNMPNEDLLALCHQCLDANTLDVARLRITLTRGEMDGSPDIAPSSTAPTLLIHAMPLDAAAIDSARARGWRVAVSPFPLNHRSPLAGIKSTSYQEKLLARHFARRNGADEALLLNTDGLVAEGAMCNLFAVRNGTILTPPAPDGALPGIMRESVLACLSETSLAGGEESLALDDFLNAEEIFATNSLIEVMPVVAVGDRPIGTGKPGRIAALLQEVHRRRVEDFLHATRNG